MPRQPSTRRWVHRNLRFDQNDHQVGADVQALQVAFNAHGPSRGVKPKLVVDGDCGRQTVAKVRQLGRALGLTMSKPGISRAAQLIIRNPGLRTPVQRARAKKYAPPVPRAQPTVNGNKATGGAPSERVAAAAIHAAFLYYHGESHRFYSQPGTYTVDHAITGEKHGERSDCSQFGTGMHWSASLLDPNGQDFEGGYTGTLGAHGTYIDRSDLVPGCFVFYGPAPHHHVEVWVGDGSRSYRELAAANHPDRDRTVGHGSPPVDFGDIDMIAGPRFSRPRGLA